ncbi:hypothetical protein [Streptomyces canus]|uniref:hypothetical protein n=1 Tax=Streptomyces canus TaxID=58343 RepID=UPI003250B393
MNLDAQCSLPHYVEGAQRRYFETAQVGDLIATGAALAGWVWAYGVVYTLFTLEFADYWPPEGGVGRLIVGGIAAAAFLLLPLYLCVALWDGRLPHVAESVAAMRRYELVGAVTQALIAADAARDPTDETGRPMRVFSGAMTTVERCVGSAARRQRRLVWRSHRRRALKEHGGLVVAALRAAEAKIDTVGSDALPEVAKLLVTIADRYCQGRPGALLDENELTGLRPAKDREPLRAAVVAVLIAAMTVGAALLGVASEAMPVLIGAFGIVAVTVVYGRRARQMTDLIGTIRG